MHLLLSFLPVNQPDFQEFMRLIPLLLGVPKTTLMFSNLIEEFMELTKPVILLAMFFYSERIEIKISKGERHIGQNS